MRDYEGIIICAVIAASIVLFLVLTGCTSVFRADQSDPLRTATSIGRIACAVVTSEGGSAEVRATRTALDAIEVAFGHDADVKAQFVLFPRRVQGYVALLFAETTDRTTDEFHMAVAAFVAGCRQTLGPVEAIGATWVV